MKRYFILSLCLCLFGCHIYRKSKSHALIFPVKEINSNYYFDYREVDLSYVFECYSYFRENNILHFRAILYQDLVRINNTADSLKRGVVGVKVLLLKYTKTNLLETFIELPQTNCYGAFNFSYDERLTSNFCLAFVKDSALNIAYDLKYLKNRFPLKAQDGNIYNVDTICQ